MDKKKIIDKEFVKLQESVKRKKIEGNITDRFVHLAYIKAWQLQRDKTNILIKKMHIVGGLIWVKPEKKM